MEKSSRSKISTEDEAGNTVSGITHKIGDYPIV